MSQRPHSIAGIVALIVIGLLLLIPSGLCTAVFAGAHMLPIAIAIGGPFIIGGGAMVVAGIRRAMENARNRRDTP